MEAVSLSVKAFFSHLRSVGSLGSKRVPLIWVVTPCLGGVRSMAASGVMAYTRYTRVPD